MAHSLKEERIETPEENGAIGGTPPEGICRKLPPDGTLIRCLGEFVEQEDQTEKERGKDQESARERKKKEKVLVIYSLPDINPMLSPWKFGRYDAESEKLYRNITSILNKLTPQLYTKLTDKALQLPIDTEERIKEVIALTFEKAIREPIYSTTYAHMCQKLSTLTVQSSSNPGQIVQFRHILVNNCQREFEKEKQSEIDEVQRREISQLPANQQEGELKLLQEQIIKAKRRTLGNICFIGELYKLRVLTENIMHNCIMKLLKAKDDDSLECLCILMSTIGKDLDHEKAKKRMDQYFKKIDKIIARQKNQPRIRFLMCNLVDLRKSNWVPRRQESKPTTIDALHREWHAAEADEGRNMGEEFTLDGASAADNGLNGVSSQGDWLHAFKKGLTSLLNERPDNNRIFDWIEHNISDTQKQHSEFIRALVTIICQNTAEGEGQSCCIDPKILKLRCPVLHRYIDNKRPLELQALYAVQALSHSLHSPPGLIRILFDVLYDEDVITEEAFYDWKRSDDPKESAGRGEALKCVIDFFTWLAEADLD